MTSCGGDLTDFANNNLYAFKAANKTEVPATTDTNYEDVYLEFNDGEQDLRVHGWAQSKGRDLPTLIYLHGNATNIGSLYKSGFMEVFNSFNANILVIDYPSYGKSTGQPTMLSLTSSVGEAISWAEQNLSTDIVLWGRSLGAGVASQAVQEYEGSIRRFILTSPWNNVSELIKHHFSSLADKVPAEWINANSYESDSALAGITTPGLIFHGNKDKVIPYEFGQKLFEGLDNGHSVNFVTIDGFEHNDIFGSSQMWQAIRAFVQKK